MDVAIITDFNKLSFEYFLCCTSLSFIYEKANCIAILSALALECHFQGVWVPCLPHKGGRVPLSALPKDTTSKLAGLFFTTFRKCRAPGREAVDTIFKVFWYDSTCGMNPQGLPTAKRTLQSLHHRVGFFVVIIK